MSFLQKAKELDSNDPLDSFKKEFTLPANTIYLDGNSLGPLPVKTAENLKKTIDFEWGNRLIRGWNDGWLESQKRTSDKIAKLIGARPGEVWITDSVSVNLYKLAYACLQQSKKKEVITDTLNFPGDIYILQQLIQTSFPSKSLKKVQIAELAKADQQIEKHLNEDIALLSLSHVTYQSAFQYDMESINAQASACEIPVIWDFSHSVGAVPIDVKKSGVQLAVGCTYKYLNGGPGAPAFLYVSEEMQSSLQNPIGGWFSHDRPFDFAVDFKENKGIQKFAVGTPPVISLKGIEEGVDIHLQAGSVEIKRKSDRMFDFFETLFETYLRPLGFGMLTPIDSAQRGSHLALTHEEAYRINLSLIHPRTYPKTIITDHRPPDIIRIALTPLYLGFEELYETAKRLESIVISKEYTEHSPVKTGVI